MAPMTLLLRLAGAIIVVFGGLALGAPASQATDVGSKDINLRKERHRLLSRIGRLPLPGTPDLDQLDERLSARGVAAGSPMLIRVFKAESTLEVWMRKGDRFELFDSYPICYWSGLIGPKIKSGDRQAPEGVFNVTAGGVRHHGRWHQALDLAYPTAYDRLQARTGSGILIHGRCSSVGCFAMTNPVIEELHDLAAAALKAGQGSVPVHVFPFRMTDANMARHKDSPWLSFWRELQPIYQEFEASKVPPRIGICDKQYVVLPGSLNDRNHYAVEPTCEYTVAGRGRKQNVSLAKLALPAVDPDVARENGLLRKRYLQAVAEARARPVRALGRSFGGGGGEQALAASGVKIRCNLQLPSCKKWAALQSSRKSKRAAGKPAKVGKKVASRTGKRNVGGGSAAGFVAK